MASAHGNHDGPRLSHPSLDPLAPVEVAAGEKRGLELRRALQVAVERIADLVDVLAQPRLEQVAELLLHLGRILDRAFEKLTLCFLGQSIEEGELLLVGLELPDRLSGGGEGLAQNRFDALFALDAKRLELHAKQSE
jgi:hypothetical protein